MSVNKIKELQKDIVRMLQEELPIVELAYEGLMEKISQVKPVNKSWSDYQCIALGPDESKILLDYIHITRSLDPKPIYHYDGIQIMGMSYWKSKTPGIHIGSYSEMQEYCKDFPKPASTDSL